ncbi:hypothetical protein IFR05_013883 [Cadophora sp. M221]|nr:hypothetical protein IFR05_013883 [Cadophora sp. M221]
MFKPFKPPALKSSARSAPIDDSVPESPPPPAKRRKLLVHVIEDSPPKKAIAPVSSGVLAPRKPLIPVKNQIQSKPADNSSSDCAESYYQVLWRKYTTKKHKTWDGDGVLSVYGGYAYLQDVSGREMGRCMFKDPLLPGSTLSIGGKDVEVDSTISKADFLAGKPFLNNTAQRTSNPSATLPKGPIVLPKGKMPLLGKKKEEDSGLEEIPAQSFYASHKSDAMKAQFKNPLLSKTIMPQNQNGSPTPRHDPNAKGALVMKRPKDCPKGKQIVDVVLDPFLGRHLLDHQREGIQFLYECVMGLRSYDGRGALLADEMGLGKTFQTICLLWTLLKQNPVHGSDPVIKKALIVCPVTLIENWKAEFRKWLGNERIGVFVEDGQSKKKITDFTHGKSYSVMIIGYERLRTVQAELKKGYGIDIVIADEGHRLKTAQNKAAQAILNLNTDRRVILSGTPMQNDLSEFFTMVDFINPGLLGKYNTFKREFEGPILKSRQPAASDRDIEKGTARGDELSALTNEFILRRAADLLSKYLKSKTEYVVFCKPTQAQAEVYQHIVSSPFFGKALGASEASLQLITILKKVCNAPRLLKSKKEDEPANPVVAALLDVIPAEIMHKSNIKASAKFRVLDKLLKVISQTTQEKVVIVSNYTSTLDLIAEHLASMSLTFLRLDGKTPQKQRQGLVDKFNKTDASTNFAFLLSAKSGGTGINLIGASRLFLFDVDWNPATDQQAMARLHRHGQKRPVKIYRLVLAGGMDEKIYQRQVMKIGLAESVIDGKTSAGSFTAEELRDLFRLDMSDGCQTHQLLGCECKGVGADLAPPSATPEPVSPSTLEDEGDQDSDDELLFPPAHAIVPGTKANVAAVEKRIEEERKKKKAKDSEGKTPALMMYRHFDAAVFRGEEEDVFGFENLEMKEAARVLDDEVLGEVLKGDNCKINYVFAKSDRAVEVESHV